LRGPRGTGFLYVRTTALDLIEPPFLDLHAADWTETDEYVLGPGASRFENWEGFVAGKIALGAAVRYLQELGPEHVFARIADLAHLLRGKLNSIDGVSVHDLGLKKGGIVTFSSDKIEAETLQKGLEEAGINVNLAYPKWAKLDADSRGLPLMIRASVHAYNSEKEIDEFVDRIAVLSDLR